jgi:Flp pilus assembly protein TadD
LLKGKPGVVGGPAEWSTLMRIRRARASRLLASASLIGLIAFASAGCGTTSWDITGATSGGGLLAGGLFARGNSDPAAGSEDDARRNASAAAEQYRSNPRDPEGAIRHAAALRQSGQRAQAVAVLQRASIHDPGNRKVLGAYGRALADAGDLAQALDVLGRAHTPEQPDWRILSAQGAVLDQMGRYADARRYYDTALKIVPDEPSVMSNLGLSYALSKDLRKAEQTLRTASAKAAKDRRIRQNLALVIGLQGRFKEAEQIARADLPAAEAAENVAYLKQMLARQQAPKPAARAPAQAAAEAEQDEAS